MTLWCGQHDLRGNDEMGHTRTSTFNLPTGFVVLPIEEGLSTVAGPKIGLCDGA